ncbi:hypothetical protein ABW20_dc0105279 [Dactylellina cionopaga]|nr:hypothetical protein ABW20_dc0105279 [Dactylellina cionopaga]
MFSFHKKRNLREKRYETNNLLAVSRQFSYDIRAAASVIRAKMGRLLDDFIQGDKSYNKTFIIGRLTPHLINILQDGRHIFHGVNHHIIATSATMDLLIAKNIFHVVVMNHGFRTRLLESSPFDAYQYVTASIFAVLHGGNIKPKSIGVVKPSFGYKDRSVDVTDFIRDLHDANYNYTGILEFLFPDEQQNSLCRCLSDYYRLERRRNRSMTHNFNDPITYSFGGWQLNFPFNYTILSKQEVEGRGQCWARIGGCPACDSRTEDLVEAHVIRFIPQLAQWDYGYPRYRIQGRRPLPRNIRRRESCLRDEIKFEENWHAWEEYHLWDFYPEKDIDMWERDLVKKHHSKWWKYNDLLPFV